MHRTQWLGGAVVAAAVALAVPALAHADGVVDRYRVDPHGRLSGVILRDGTEIVVTGAQAAAVSAAVRPGDLVRTPGGPQNTLELQDPRTGRTIDLGSIDSVARGGGPVSAAVPYARVDDARPLRAFTVRERVAYVTHTPNGDPSGFVLRDGTQVHLVPAVAGVTSEIRPGDLLRVDGRGTPSAYGLGLWGMTITRPTGLVVLDMTRGIGAPELGLGR